MPIGLPLLLGGTALGAVGSLFGGRKPPDIRQLEQLFGTGALAKRQNELFGLLANSPSFRSALGNTNVAGQQLGQQIDANLAKSGLLGTSGVGAVGSALGNAAGGFGTQQLVGGLHQTAAEQAGQLNQLLAQLFGQFESQRASQQSPFQLGGGALLGALGPLLAQYFRPAGMGSTGTFGAGPTRVM